MPMTFQQFAEVNRDRCESPAGFGHALDSWSLSDWMTALLGELGEAANAAKKLNRVRDGVPGNKETAEELRAKLLRELGDAAVYLDLLCQSQGFTLEQAARAAFDAKSVEIGYPWRSDMKSYDGRHLAVKCRGKCGRLVPYHSARLVTLAPKDETGYSTVGHACPGCAPDYTPLSKE